MGYTRIDYVIRHVVFVETHIDRASGKFRVSLQE